MRIAFIEYHDFVTEMLLICFRSQPWLQRFHSIQYTIYHGNITSQHGWLLGGTEIDCFPELLMTSGVGFVVRMASSLNRAVSDEGAFSDLLRKGNRRFL